MYDDYLFHAASGEDPTTYHQQLNSTPADHAVDEVNEITDLQMRRKMRRLGVVDWVVVVVVDGELVY